MIRQLLIAGGGIGGLAAGLAAARAGWGARVFEQAQSFSEVGAGLQLGPNATRVLREWGVIPLLEAKACIPARLVARDARSGRELAALPLGESFESRYGAPYLTVLRADLHAALLQVLRGTHVCLDAGRRVAGVVEQSENVRAVLSDGMSCEGDALVGADGLWSAVRPALVADGPPRPSGHAAYRALVSMDRLSAALRVPEVTAWLGPRLHAVTYPVCRGALLNVVCVVQQTVEGPRHGWDLLGTGDRLRVALGPVCDRLQDILGAAPPWGLWVLHDRASVSGAHQMARGRVALLGDAAHPMRPYLAQGAAMALEDAYELERCLSAVRDRTVDVESGLQRYALNRWQRVARVQRRSVRNAAIFHAAGPVRLARDLALRGLGARLMDVPWLYGG